MKTHAPTTRTPAELKERISQVDAQMRHQPARRGFADLPRIDTSGCTNPSCSNRRCSCSRKRSSR